MSGGVLPTSKYAARKEYCRKHDDTSNSMHHVFFIAKIVNYCLAESIREP